MAELHEILATPLELRIAGRILRISPLTDADWAELQLWMRSRMIDLAREAAKDESPEVKKAILAQVAEKAFELYLSSPEAEGFLTRDIETISYLFWLSLRHEHPQMTREDVLQLSADREIMNALTEKLDTLTELLSKKKSRRAKQMANRTRRWPIVSWLSGMAGRRSRSET